jgi:isopentenyl-diphosphate Delta-isomerase
MTDEIILVNENDEQIGTAGKLEAHERGVLHRAFSVFLFNTQGQMLLQQRALSKYHSAGLWTNACCSHPLPGEDIERAAHRRLQEELGFDTKLTKAFEFTYKATFDNGLTEYEYDHVFIGTYNDSIKFNKAEVNSISYVDISNLTKQIKDNPHQFTAWFKIALPLLLEWQHKK